MWVISGGAFRSAWPDIWKANTVSQLRTKSSHSGGDARYGGGQPSRSINLMWRRVGLHLSQLLMSNKKICTSEKVHDAPFIDSLCKTNALIQKTIIEIVWFSHNVGHKPITDSFYFHKTTKCHITSTDVSPSLLNLQNNTNRWSSSHQASRLTSKLKP